MVNLKDATTKIKLNTLKKKTYSGFSNGFSSATAARCELLPRSDAGYYRLWLFNWGFAYGSNPDPGILLFPASSSFANGFFTFYWFAFPLLFALAWLGNETIPSFWNNSSGKSISSSFYCYGTLALLGSISDDPIGNSACYCTKLFCLADFWGLLYNEPPIPNRSTFSTLFSTSRPLTSCNSFFRLLFWGIFKPIF